MATESPRGPASISHDLGGFFPAADLFKDYLAIGFSANYFVSCSRFYVGPRCPRPRCLAFQKVQRNAQRLQGVSEIRGFRQAHARISGLLSSVG
jgi:hypothetical protein